MPQGQRSTPVQLIDMVCMVEVTGRVVRVGRKSLDVEVELIAEAPVSGERRLCTRGRFTLIAVGSEDPLPPIGETFLHDAEQPL